MLSLPRKQAIKHNPDFFRREMAAGSAANVLDNLFGRTFPAASLRRHVRSFVIDENRTLLKSYPQFCAIGADPGQAGTLSRQVNAGIKILRIPIRSHPFYHVESRGFVLGPPNDGDKDGCTYPDRDFLIELDEQTLDTGSCTQGASVLHG
jgi:hypothetical protein